MADDGRRRPSPPARAAAKPSATEALWRRLEQLSYPAQIAAVEGDARFHTATLCRRLQRISQAASGVNPEVGLQLANLAVRISFHLGAGRDQASLRDLRALAFAYLGDARRAVGELLSAGDAFGVAQTLRARGTGDPWVEAETLGFEALLRLEQHRLTGAVSLLDRVLAIHAAHAAVQPGHVAPRGRLDAVVLKAWCLYHLGEHQAAQGLLAAAEQQLDDSRDGHLLLPIRNGLLWCAIALDEWPAAPARLAAAVAAAGSRPDQAARLRLDRAAARIHLALGERGAAEQALRQAAPALARLALGTDATLAWLALAKLEIEEAASRRTLERIVARILPAIVAEAGREQLLGLFLFVNDCTQGKLTTAAVTRFARDLEVARPPSLAWWSEWGTAWAEEGTRDAAPHRAG